jgi:hypothetical protein
MTSRTLLILVLIILNLCTQVFDPLQFSSQADVYANIVLQDEEDVLSPNRVIKSIETGRQFLVSQQAGDGSWSFEGGSRKVGLTSLAVLALINAGLPPNHPAVAKGLKVLRALRDPEPDNTYDISVLIMALVAANNRQSDSLQVFQLTQRLIKMQVTSGANKGSWGYTLRNMSPDRSNSQYAIMALREAAYFGVPVQREVWENAHAYYRTTQNVDGGWDYSGNAGNDSYGSMTVAGISSITICERFLKNTNEVDANGQPLCCQEQPPSVILDRAYQWMARNFTVRENAGGYKHWKLYYIYGLERAGRLSGQRFFGEHDWYRDGVRELVTSQEKFTGGWIGSDYESDQKLATCFALLFLSKGLSPVVVNKVKYGPRNVNQPEQVIGSDWNKHRDDVRNLVEHMTTLDGWPHLMTWQEVDLGLASRQGGVESLLQAPILYFSGSQNISDKINEQELELLRAYVVQGGLIFAVNNCQSGDFDQGIHQLIRRMYADRDITLKPLEPNHAVFKSWYQLSTDSVKLEGANVGCRTAIIYSPDDVSCLWDKWSIYDPPQRTAAIQSLIAKSMRIGVNVTAYATGGTLLNKLQQQEIANQAETPQKLIADGYLKIAKIKHSGDWDAAPTAISKLLTALKQNVGSSTTTKSVSIPATDPTLFRYGLVYMHGQQKFRLTKEEQAQLKKYLENGGVFFADACCGAEHFDKSFREMMAEMFPQQPLEQIPVNHEIFTDKVGYNIPTLKRRMPDLGRGVQGSSQKPVDLPPFLEGIKIEDRYVVIYSKFDISCALERQSSIDCIGYTPEDAVKLAVNIVLYAILQDVLLIEEAISRDDL